MAVKIDNQVIAAVEEILKRGNLAVKRQQQRPLDSVHCQRPLNGRLAMTDFRRKAISAIVKKRDIYYPIM
jgi:hypothetical protein